MKDSQRFAFVAEIVNRAGEPCGMGILIASDRVLTCAHVVNLAMERPLVGEGDPSGNTSVEVRFPFYPGGKSRGTVLHWYAPAGKQAVNDCCVLALRSPLGREVEPAQFAEATPGREFQAPRRTGQGSPLTWVYGTIGDPSTSGLYEANKQGEANRSFIVPGCSGGPVIDKDSDQVLGMVVWANPESENAHIAPTQTLKHACQLRMENAGDMSPAVAKYVRASRRFLLTRRRWLWGAAAATATTAVGSLIWRIAGKPRLRIGIKPFVGYAPLMVAQKLDLWRNVEVHFTEVETVVEMKNLVGAGELDAGLWLSCTHGLFRSDSHPVKAKVVLKLDESKQGDGIIVQPDVADFADLTGKRIATQKHDAGEYMFRTLCAKHSIEYHTLTVRHVSAVVAKELFLADRVQAASTYEPHLDVIRKKKMIEPKWTAQDLGQFGIVDVLAVREDYLEKHTAAVKGLIEGWYKAVDLLQGSDQKAVAIAVEFLRTAETPDYNADNLKQDIAPDVVKLADREDNRKFFKLMDERSDCLDHYENGMKVFERELFQRSPFNEWDIPEKFHPKA